MPRDACHNRDDDDDDEARGRPTNSANANAKRRRTDRHKQDCVACKLCCKVYSRSYYHQHMRTAHKVKGTCEDVGDSNTSSTDEDFVNAGENIDSDEHTGDIEDDHGGAGSENGNDEEPDIHDGSDDDDGEDDWETDSEIDADVQEPSDDDDNDDEPDGVEDEDMKKVIKAHLIQFLNLQSTHSLSDTGFLSMWKCACSLILKLMDPQNVQKIDKALPKTLYGIRKLVSLERDNFNRYVLCKKCDSRYTTEQATKKLPNGQLASNRCTFVKHAEHRLPRMRRPCGELLMKSVVSKTGKTFLYPRKSFCQQSLGTSIQRVINSHPNAFELFDHWRDSFKPDTNFDDPNTVLSDVYDGRIWRDFQHVGGKPFLAEPGNLALMFNVDWFQPFKHSRHSVGAMYFVILNLPRHLRFRIENVLLVGVIGGPKEPRMTLNSCLLPVVNDLLQLWEGRLFDDPNSMIGKRLVRAGVLCLSADIPALRKCGGFVGHAATKGCSKCEISFPRIGNTPRADYSNYEQGVPLRNGPGHIALARRSRNARTETERNRFEMQHGVRWSEFYRLPYLDPVRMHAIDPMHCLYTGCVSHTISVWKDRNVLNDANMALIQERVDRLKVPSSVGRIPNKIDSNFSSLTADQLRTWMHVYSIYALRGLVSNADVNVWRLFEAACRNISSRRVSVQQVLRSETLFRMYCVSFRDRYGAASCTMNQHLLGHLKDCVLDYGPIYSFWLFSFERYNGAFERFQTNNRDVAIQLIRRFRTTQIAAEKASQCPDDLFWPGLAPDNPQDKGRGTIGQMTSVDWDTFESLTMRNVFDLSCNTSLNSVVEPALKELLVFDETEREVVTEMFRELRLDVVRISYHYSSFLKCRIGGVAVHVKRYEHDRSSCIEAKWVESVNGVPTVSLDSVLRPGILTELKSLVVHCSNGIQIPVSIAKVQWMDDSDLKNVYGASSMVSVWSMNDLPANCTAYIPLNRIRNRCAFVVSDVAPDRVGRVVVPLP